MAYESLSVDDVSDLDLLDVPTSEEEEELLQPTLQPSGLIS